MFKKVTNVININTEKNVYDMLINIFKLDDKIIKKDKVLYNYINDLKMNILININNIIQRINKNNCTCEKTHEIRYYINFNLIKIPEYINKIIEKINNDLMSQILIKLIYEFIKRKYENTELLNNTLYILF